MFRCQSEGLRESDISGLSTVDGAIGVQDAVTTRMKIGDSNCSIE